jgi:alpha-glucosidase
MQHTIFTFTAVILTFILNSFSFSQTNNLIVSSPDKNILVSINIMEKLEPYPSGERLYYNVSFKGKEVIKDSPWGLDFKNMAPIGKNLKITNSKPSSFNETWERVWGKNKIVTNNYNELTINLKETSSLERKVNIIFRVYNDGIAFRYQLPEQESLKEFELTSERSWFAFYGNHTAWAVDYEAFASHQESEFKKTTLSKIEESNIIGLPLLVKADDSCWVAITESNLTDWAGMYVTSAGIPNALVTTLSPRFDDKSVLVKSKAPRFSPWRTIMIGNNPGVLIESNIVSNLNEPCAFKDVSWIEPGISSWDWWWCNGYAPNAGFKLGSNTETMKYFIDFSAKHGFTYQLVDWHWYDPPFTDDWKPDPSVDILTPNKDMDIEGVIKYGKEKGVKIMIWLEWSQLNAKMDEALALYSKWGVSGIKVDFMDRDDQEMVNFYHTLVKKAEKYKLLVNFHGAYKPTGISRTYPNLITREGVMGNEYNKWSKRITPEYTTTIPFTRGLLGEVDITPGGFRHGTKETFKVQKDSIPPMVMGTRCHQLALFVAVESALVVLADSPDSYEGQPGFEFIKKVPTTWDDTKYLDGSVGEYIAIARKSGDEWYIGCMTNWDERELKISLSFLEKGEFVAEIHKDAPEANTQPEKLIIETIDVTNQTELKVKMASGGGYVVHIRKK